MQPLGNVYTFIIVSVPLLSSITFSNQYDVLFFTLLSTSMVHLTRFFVVVHHPILLLLTPHNPARLSYAFYFTFGLLGTFRISCFYRSPRLCTHRVANILNSPPNMRFMHAYINLCVHFQWVCWVCCHLL